MSSSCIPKRAEKSLPTNRLCPCSVFLDLNYNLYWSLEMKHSITYYPVGSGDTALICANEGTPNLFVMLVDFCNRPRHTPGITYVDVDSALKTTMAALDRTYFDVVLITHIDNDHVAGIENFIELNYAKKYQGNGRFKANELWVPAAAVYEKGSQVQDSAYCVRSEARHRLRRQDGRGLRIFSFPSALDDFLRKNNIDPSVLDRVVTQAGLYVRTPAMRSAGLSLFIHSPLAHVQDDAGKSERNRDSIVFQAIFDVGSADDVTAMFYSDLKSNDLIHVCQVTLGHGNSDTLVYDVLKTPHHSSYLSLAKDKDSIPSDLEPEIEHLFDTSGKNRAIIISSSCASSKNNGNDPPHQEAVDYFKMLAKKKGGDFRITDNEPDVKNPAPLVVIIDHEGARIKRRESTYKSKVSKTPHRAG